MKDLEEEQRIYENVINSANLSVARNFRREKKKDNIRYLSKSRTSILFEESRMHYFYSKNVFATIFAILCMIQTVAAQKSSTASISSTVDPVCERIVESNLNINGKKVPSAESGRFRPFGQRFVSPFSGSSNKYRSDDNGPYTPLTGFAQVLLDDVAASPVLTRLGRFNPSSGESVYNDPGRKTSGYITAQIHYPRELMADPERQLPVIVLSPPLQVANELVASFFQTDFFLPYLRFFASHGFITITTTETSSKEWNRGAEIKIGNRVMDLLRYVEAQNDTPGSFLYNRYNKFAGAFGVSMGGGALLYTNTLANSGLAATAVIVPRCVQLLFFLCLAYERVLEEEREREQFFLASVSNSIQFPK